MFDRMSNYWVNFAKTGNPNGSELPLWRPFAAEDQQVMYLGASCGMQPVQHRERLEVLDAYYAWQREQAGKKSEGDFIENKVQHAASGKSITNSQ